MLLDLESLVVGQPESSVDAAHAAARWSIAIRVSEWLIGARYCGSLRPAEDNDYLAQCQQCLSLEWHMARPKRKHACPAEHKAALAAGRKKARALSNYLEALEASKPKRGRKRTPDSISKRLGHRSRTSWPIADPLRRLQLVQERMDLQAELEAADAPSTSPRSRPSS